MKNKILLASILLVLTTVSYFFLIYPDDYLSIRFGKLKNRKELVFHQEGDYIALVRSEENIDALLPLLKNPELAFSDEQDWIKDRHIRSIVVYQTTDKAYFIKRHLNHKWDQYLTHNPSKGLRSFYYGCLFDKLEIPNPKSIAIIEKRKGPFRFASYHISEYVPGLIGDDYLKQKDLSPQELSQSVLSSVDIVQKLDQAQIIHGDLRVKHLFYVEGKPHVIDLDTVHHFRFRNRFFIKRQNYKDLKRFVMGMLANLNEKQTEFFKAYYRAKMKDRDQGLLD